MHVIYIQKNHLRGTAVLGFNSSLARGAFCHLLITFANSLDPDQDLQDVGSGLNTNGLSL